MSRLFNAAFAARRTKQLVMASGFLGLLSLLQTSTANADLSLRLTSQTETSESSGRYHRLSHEETWNPEQTAIIVCDMWDLHHCLNAVRREKQFAPRLDNVLKSLREQGVTVIHAPSSCMDAYADHPARLRAIETPMSSSLPDRITEWCYQIPSEEAGVYPIDQSDGGEDDDLEEHAAWAQELADMGLNPRAPWTRQIDLITIDDAQDYISDRGDEIWSILEAKGIENVILSGVHTNMCVLGRPFGLRQMAQNGKNVVLMRDMTDTMYNPLSAPYVSHFTGTDLIIDHIERHVCPTITSDQIIGGEVFRFAEDTRPHVVIVVAEDEYETAATLPKFALSELGKKFRVSFVFGNDQVRNDLPGFEVIEDADLLFISMRRRTLPEDQLDVFRKHVEAGKSVVGIRTSSHAFCLRNQPAPEGLADWPEFDRDVFGGNYTNHYGNSLESTVFVETEQLQHPILEEIERVEFAQGGSLYRTSPLADGATVLAVGSVEGEKPEPVAWTISREDGGKSFYTSLGHVEDFEDPTFVRILANSISWALEDD